MRRFSSSQSHNDTSAKIAIPLPTDVEDSSPSNSEEALSSGAIGGASCRRKFRRKRCTRSQRSDEAPMSGSSTDISSLEVDLTSNNSEVPPAKEAAETHHSLYEPTASQCFSEFDICTDPRIYPFPHLIVRRAYIDPSAQLPLPRKGYHGFLSLKTESGCKSKMVDSLLAQFWLSLKGLLVPLNRDQRAQQVYPTPSTPRLFRKHGTMVFLETTGGYTNSGEALFEFLGNFYIRRGVGSIGVDSTTTTGGLLVLEFIEDPGY